MKLYKKICKLKSTNGGITTNRDEILKIAEEFYSELYKQDEEFLDRQPTPKIQYVGSEDIPDTSEDEVISAIANIQNNKVPGEDDIDRKSVV